MSWIAVLRKGINVSLWHLKNTKLVHYLPDRSIFIRKRRVLGPPPTMMVSDSISSENMLGMKKSTYAKENKNNNWFWINSHSRCLRINQTFLIHTSLFEITTTILNPKIRTIISPPPHNAYPKSFFQSCSQSGYRLIKWNLISPSSIPLLDSLLST